MNLILPQLEDLLSRGGQRRLVVGDYLDVTEPSALRTLRDLDKEGQRQARQKFRSCLKSQPLNAQPCLNWQPGLDKIV